MRFDKGKFHHLYLKNNYYCSRYCCRSAGIEIYTIIVLYTSIISDSIIGAGVSGAVEINPYRSLLLTKIIRDHIKIAQTIEINTVLTIGPRGTNITSYTIK